MPWGNQMMMNNRSVCIGQVMLNLTAATVLLLVSAAKNADGADKADKEQINGLTGEYFAGNNFERLVATRVDPQINWMWDHASPEPGLSNQHFSVRWTGWLKAPRPGRYTIISNTDDHSKLWIDDVLLLEHGGKGGSVTVELTGKPQAIRMDYSSGGNPNWAGLNWIPPGLSETPIPPEAFFLEKEAAEASRGFGTTRPSLNGLKTEYFLGRDLKRRVFTRYTADVNNLWSFGAPLAEMPSNDFSIRWTGWLKPPKPGKYRIVLWADDHANVWIDRKLIIDKWGEAVVELDEEPHTIAVEFAEGRKYASISLQWVPPGEEYRYIIPASAFFRNRTALKSP